MEIMKKIDYYEASRDNSLCPACFKTEHNYPIAHFHSAIELIYIAKGELNATVAGESINLKQGSLLVVPSYDIHMYNNYKEVEDIVLIIPLGYIVNSENVFASKTFTQTVLDDAFAIEIGDYMRKLSQMDFESHPMIIRGLIYQILGTLLQALEMTDRKIIDYKPIQKILNYIEDNYKSPLSLDLLSKKFGFNKSHLSHIFNENVGCSFPEYLGKLRSQNVASLIENENYSVIDAAMESGFESVRTFYRAFFKNYNITPAQFKKNAINKKVGNIASV